MGLSCSKEDDPDASIEAIDIATHIGCPQNSPAARPDESYDLLFTKELCEYKNSSQRAKWESAGCEPHIVAHTDTNSEDPQLLHRLYSQSKQEVSLPEADSTCSTRDAEHSATESGGYAYLSL